MAVVFKTGEVIFCNEVEVFNDCILADMTFIPIGEVYDIMELEEPA